MASKVEMYRQQVAIAVCISLNIKYDDAVAKLTDHHDLIDAWCGNEVPFTDTAALIAAELT